jgi:hypothetical protein
MAMAPPYPAAMSTFTSMPPPHAAPGPDLEVLDRIQRRVLWLATAMVQHANVVRANSSGVKVGGHQSSSASMVSLMTALWFGSLRARAWQARPRGHEAHRTHRGTRRARGRTPGRGDDNRRRRAIGRRRLGAATPPGTRGGEASPRGRGTRVGALRRQRAPSNQVTAPTVWQTIPTTLYRWEGRLVAAKARSPSPGDSLSQRETRSPRARLRWIAISRPLCGVCPWRSNCAG